MGWSSHRPPPVVAAAHTINTGQVQKERPAVPTPTASTQGASSRVCPTTQLCSAVAGIAGDMFKVALNGLNSALDLVEAVLTPNPFGERVPTSYTPGHPPT